MTGPEHYREAERMLFEAEDLGDVAEAQVHATLALAAATAACAPGAKTEQEWREAGATP